MSWKYFEIACTGGLPRYVQTVISTLERASYEVLTRRSETGSIATVLQAAQDTKGDVSGLSILYFMMDNNYHETRREHFYAICHGSATVISS